MTFWISRPRAATRTTGACTGCAITTATSRHRQPVRASVRRIAASPLSQEEYDERKRHKPRRRLAAPRGCADLRDHGAAYRPWRRRRGHALLRHARYVSADRNGL